MVWPFAAGEAIKKPMRCDGLIGPKLLTLMENAPRKVSKNHRLQIVFDKSGDLVMIYTDPIHDYTDYVLDELGLGDPNDVIK